MTTVNKTDARKLDHATLDAMRLRAVAAARVGMKAADLAQAYGVNRRAVFRWLADFYEGGEPAHKAKPIPDRPAKLDESQMRLPAQTVTDQTPLEHGFEVGLWTLSLMRELIRRQFGYTLALASVSRVEAAGHHGAKAALPCLEAGSRARAAVGAPGVPRDQAAGACPGRDGVLCRRVGHPL